MGKKRVYVESSVISYLAAKPARDVVKQANQRLTYEWWESRTRWNLFISPVVIREIRRGDPDAVRERLNRVLGWPVLPETDEARVLAEGLIAAGVLAATMYADAMHIALAVVHGMDALVTWNQKHICNPARLESAYAAIRRLGWKPAVLMRPDNLVEVDHDT